MSEAIWLVTKDDTGGAETLINGVRAAIINKDSATTSANVIAAAASALASQSGASVPDNYFTTATDITDLAAGPLKDDGDAYLLQTDGVVLAKVEG